MIGFIVFYVVPTIRGVYLSFTEYNILGDPEWVGLDNYTAIAKDPLFWNSLAVTGQYVLINIVLQTALALGLALLMHKVAKSTLIRGALLLPYLMSNVIAALLWFWMLDYQIGVVNQFIEWAGLPRVAFFGSEEWAIPTQALINTWRHMGYTALLIFAGLQAIPQPRLRGGQTGRRLTVPDLPQDHHAAAAPGPGPGPGRHRDRFLPGLRHRGRDHRRAARSTPPASSSTTSTSAPSPSRTSATDPPSPSFSSSSSPWWPSSR